MATYTNSSLVTYKKISPMKDSTRVHSKYNPKGVIDKITIHHMAGNLSIETCGNVFQYREASSNYGIGSDGRIGMYVEEKHRSWASSSPANDYRAITIEVANDGGEDENWHVSSKAINSLIKLCIDICKRNNIKKIEYTGDAKGNLTRHNMFVSTICPGPYLQSKFDYIAEQVNKEIEFKEYRAAVNVDALIVREGPSSDTDKIDVIRDRACYLISDEENGFGKLKNFPGWINLDYTFKEYKVKVTVDALIIREFADPDSPKIGVIRDKGIYTIRDRENGFGKLKGQKGWINLDYTKKV